MWSLLLIISSWASGLAILKLTDLNFLTRVTTALVLGIVVHLLLIFSASLIWGLNPGLVIFVVIMLSAVSFYVLRNNFLSIEFKPAKIRADWVTVFVIFSLLTLLALIFFKSIYINDEGIIAGNRLVWIDWPIHFSLIASFVHGDNFPPENPLYSNQLITYPFFTDFMSAVLQVLGAGIKSSLVLPGIILGILLILLLYQLGLIICRNPRVAVAGVVISLIWGGLGFLYFFEDLIASGDFLSTFVYPPHEYTFYSQKNLWFFSFLYSEFLPQRGIMLGVLIFLVCLILFILGISKNKRGYLMIAGYLAGVMPVFHMHSYLSLVFISVALSVLNLIFKNGQKFSFLVKQFFQTIVYFFLPMLGLGLLQLPLFTKVDLNQTIGFNWGWMKGEENFFVFWFKNTGLFWPLFVFAIFKIKFTQLIRNLAISSILLFILANIFKFATWPYDNLKIFTFWYFIASFYVAVALQYLYRKNFLLKTFTVIMFLTLVLSGVLELFRVINNQSSRLRIWSNDDIELGRVIMEKTEPKSVILAAAVHDHPVTGIAGRKLIIGFPGNAWSWGLADWSKRESDVRFALRGDPAHTDKILASYNVDYVLISSREKYFEPMMNEDFFKNNALLIAVGKDFRLYQFK